jgi:mono/diheme cytochrome c family protein
MKRTLLAALAGMIAGGITVRLPGVRAGADASDDAKPSSDGPAIALNYEQSNGQKLFEHYCAVCHGASGEGDGFNAFNLNPKPRNLADRESMPRFSDQQLFAAISQGGLERGKSNLMPPWGNTLNERQVRYLVAYLRTLGEAK